ncbi:MAG: TRAP transporter small permease [Nisaea sp.]|uniref:TRAP transporter small permease n=1 Tax=Nisaea sp. TaxID=2024842 RepID=UPI001B2A1612|nr:TRAP transporter small permease [Nisaea sp.]MBO6561556.1 TRAP transporter small permease [Nisaea sp.]
MILRCIDAVSEFTGKLCAWSLVAVGFFITFEIVMRYVFIAPTIWVDEVSRILQVWVVYLGAAYVLKHREMVTIELILRDPRSLWRRLAESFAIIVMFVFAGVAIYYGFSLWLKETIAGHTTDTYLAPPKWITSAPVWLGNALLVLQGLAQLVRVWTENLPEDDVLEGAH